MVLDNNPFTSETYNQEWVNSYLKGEKCYKFNFIEGVAFTKNRYLPLYTNIGKYKSCGISYSLNHGETKDDYKGKVFVLYDIPSYLPSIQTGEVGLKSITQYKGYGIDLADYKTINDYLQKFSRNRKRSLIKGLRKLEKDYDIEYVWLEKVDKVEFDKVFNTLFELIDETFKQKKTINSHSIKKVKSWYKSLFFKLINEGKAAFFIIKNSKEVIAVSFNYFSNNIFFAAIPSYNRKYREYGIGNIQMLKEMEWSINHNLEYYDLGKGSYGYKQIWASEEYSFEYHILYDRKNWLSKIIANFLCFYFSLKAFLRVLKQRFFTKVRSILKNDSKK